MKGHGNSYSRPRAEWLKGQGDHLDKKHLEQQAAVPTPCAVITHAGGGCMDTFSLRTRGHRGREGLGLSLSLAFNEPRISDESTDSTPSPQAEKQSAPAQGEEA